MIFKKMDIGKLSIDQTKKYYPMLSEQRKKKINDLESVDERAVLFCGEILARQCLSELFDAPESAFQLLCNPDSKSIVGNFQASLSISAAGRTVACAAGTENVGVCVKEFVPFAFSDAQKLFTDGELRAVYALSNCSFAELINQPACDEKKVMQAFALFSSLKDAYFYASGKGFRSNLNKVEFIYNGSTVTCSDSDYRVACFEIDEAAKTAVSVVERIMK